MFKMKTLGKMPSMFSFSSSLRLSPTKGLTLSPHHLTVDSSFLMEFE